MEVSTHSRAEAAANSERMRFEIKICFNTQPRGGGCKADLKFIATNNVSTHSRAEAAAH